MISVVLPVYNERENIGPCLTEIAAALSEEAHEILVCYDFDEDTTLGGIEAMENKPSTLRLVKNDIGRGVVGALCSGFSAAKGDVVVVTMADLSDPPAAISAMAAKVRQGFSVVGGSRYMPGGSHTGGPLIKKILSKVAGTSLGMAGLGTVDATNNFRAYCTRFLTEVEVESRQGFAVALELTVKAFLRGKKVGEVPSSWQDRSAGQSRFQLVGWLPEYLRWYWAFFSPSRRRERSAIGSH